MIVVDTSALIAVALEEPLAGACMAVISRGELAISAATYAEALIVARLRNASERMAAMLAGLDFEVVSLDESMARLVGEAYSRWGKSIHPAKLNYGDCFAYALAKERDCPLLYIGNDFAQTDIRSALQGGNP